MIWFADRISGFFAGRDPFQVLQDHESENLRQVKNRRTYRLVFENKVFYVKYHRGVGWKEIWKNLLQFKKPVISAANEYRALNELSKLSIPTMTIAGFGIRNFNPANQDSFIITDELSGTVSLEEFTADWSKKPPVSELKHFLILKLAEIIRRMHQAGINHRDCYLCHFHYSPEAKKLFVIDLHRAQCRKQVPWHYLVKDVAGIYFSSMDLPLSKRDILRFMSIYSGRNVRQDIARGFWHSIQNTAGKLYRKEYGKNPPLQF